MLECAKGPYSAYDMCYLVLFRLDLTGFFLENHTFCAIISTFSLQILLSIISVSGILKERYGNGSRNFSCINYIQK